jgi:hypothetical protein
MQKALAQHTLSSSLPPETPVDCQRLILQRRSVHLNGALTVGKYVPTPYPQPVTIGTHELMEGAFTQCEHQPSDAAPEYGAAHMGQGSVLAYRLQPAKKSEVNWRDANRRVPLNPAGWWAQLVGALRVHRHKH